MEKSDDKSSIMRERPYYLHRQYGDLCDTNSAQFLMRKIRTKDEIGAHLIARDSIVYERQGMLGFNSFGN